MDELQQRRIAAVLEAAKDMTVATLRPDGWPQATTVSFVSEGVDIFFGCDERSQKAQNLARDDRVSVTVNLPYDDWEEIRGLSLGGRATRLVDDEDLARVGALMSAKFPQVSQYVSEGRENLTVFRITPVAVTLLDYRQGFGATEHITA